MSITVPPIWFKTQRVLRTIVQALVVLVPTVNLAAIALIGYLGEQAYVQVPGWVFIALNGTVAVTAIVMGAIARLMAVPRVNDFLARFGLGSVPASAITKSD